MQRASPIFALQALITALSVASTQLPSRQDQVANQCRRPGRHSSTPPCSGAGSMAPGSQDCVEQAMSTAGVMAAAGVPVGFFRAHAALKNLTLEQKMQRWANLKLTGRIMANPMATFGAAGAAFAAANCASHAYLGRDDVLNGMVGGAAVGAVLGLKASSGAVALKYGALFAGAMLVTDFLTRFVPNVVGDLKPTGPVRLGEKPAGV